MDISVGQGVPHMYIYIYTHVYIHIYIYNVSIYICVHMYRHTSISIRSCTVINRRRPSGRSSRFLLRYHQGSRTAVTKRAVLSVDMAVSVS